MQELSTRFAQMLLNVKCIKVQPEAPFTWASGWLSPFYCDNRKTLAYPDVRTFVKEQLARIVSEKYPQATAIAGVATGAIAQGALVPMPSDSPCATSAPKPRTTAWATSSKAHCPKGQRWAS